MIPQQIIVRPLVTEKTTDLQADHNQFAFEVAKHANKIEIRKAVESLFDVRVEGVRTMNYRGKTRRVGRIPGRRAGYKKAIVRLAAGQTIDVYEGV